MKHLIDQFIKEKLAFEDNLSMKSVSMRQVIAKQSSLNFNKAHLI